MESAKSMFSPNSNRANFHLLSHAYGVYNPSDEERAFQNEGTYRWKGKRQHGLESGLHIHPPGSFTLGAVEHDGQALKPEKLKTPLCHIQSLRPTVSLVPDKRRGIHFLKRE